MNVCKLIGGGLVLAGAFLLSHRLVLQERCKVRQCSAYLTLLRQIRAQIACYSRSFSAICQSIDAQLLRDCGLGLPGDSFAVMLASAALTLPPDAETLLRHFAAELGKSYKEEQIVTCDETIAQLTEICRREEGALRERVRLIRAFCICGGLALILLLW